MPSSPSPLECNSPSCSSHAQCPINKKIFICRWRTGGGEYEIACKEFLSAKRHGQTLIVSQFTDLFRMGFISVSIFFVYRPISRLIAVSRLSSHSRWMQLPDDDAFLPLSTVHVSQMPEHGHGIGNEYNRKGPTTTGPGGWWGEESEDGVTRNDIVGHVIPEEGWCFGLPKAVFLWTHSRTGNV